MLKYLELEIDLLEEKYGRKDRYEQPLKLFFYNNIYRVIKENIKELEKLNLKQKLNSISLESIMIYFKMNEDDKYIFDNERLFEFIKEYLNGIEFPNLRRLQLELEKEESRIKKIKNVYSFSKTIYFYSSIVSYLETELMNKDKEEREIQDFNLYDLYLFDIYDYYNDCIYDKTQFNIDDPEQIRELILDYLKL